MYANDEHPASFTTFWELRGSLMIITNSKRNTLEKSKHLQKL
jgi:hypothetical protein